MNILYVCHRFPYPPTRGGKIRPFHMIRHLSQMHKVTVASIVRSEAEKEEGKDLGSYCARVETAVVHNPMQLARMIGRLPTPTPSSMGWFYSPELARRIRALLAEQRFDLIFVHCSSVAQYVADVIGIPKVLDFGDMDSQKWLEYARYKPFPVSAGYWLEGVKLEREEKRLAQKFEMCTVTTRAELETLDGYGGACATDWFPNGVDSEFFAPESEDYEGDTLCFIGRMDYYPNQECMVEFCANTLPLVRAERPDVKLLVVGADPSPAVKRLAEIPGVTVTGSVPDVRPFVRRSALMVAPLNIARGTQNKLLESMALGVPVVSSRIAAKGIDAAPDEHLLVGSTPQEYARAILRILTDRGERRRLAAAGRQRMLSHHGWSHSMARLDAIVERCVSGVRRVRPSAELAGQRM